MISRAFPIAARASVGRISIRALLIGVVVCLSACATAPSSSTSAGGASNGAINPGSALSLNDVAVDDLVRALVQYRDPIATTLQAGLSMASEDNAGLLAILSERGYGLQLVDADQGAHLLHHSVEDTQSGDTPMSRHTLSVGQLELSREYATINAVSRPIGPLTVSGSRRRISLDDSRFGENVTNGLEVSNVYFGGDNFGSILDDYSKVETVSVIFPNDSMRLGNIGRLKIDVFLGDFDEEFDLIRVVGCSNGTTHVEIVTQELLARGVTREHILDEGCWGPQPIGERFPSRGVVLELYRTS